MLRKTYYMVLGVTPTESRRGIRRAFKELARRYHPDCAGASCLSVFQEIVEAYKVLSDAERRRHYEQGLSHSGAGAGALSMPVLAGGATEADSLVPELFLPVRAEIDRARFDAAFARIAALLAGGRAPSRERCQALDVQVMLAPEDAVKGGTALISVPGCSPCRKCGGTGREGLFPCRACDGEGLLEEEETVEIRIPPMVGDATVIEAPSRTLGVHGFYLRVQVRVVSQKAH
ncbi:MAG TPA: DnaJ domain-containing protein [candidate division Zixibacteria bacterium]|nr:DnaJ domain-containing protein [candidate division Zixibacteria bacterium]